MQAGLEAKMGYYMQQITDSKFSPEERLRNRPTTNYPADLPVAHQRREIAEAIERNQVLVLTGETGSGKTTQLPKICLDAGRGINGLIGHTQPRRIAARSIAQRVAEELSTPLEQAVGYKVRFTDKTNPDGYIKLMTDGILLAETRSDPLLKQYDTIIIDEAHERSLNIDFLIGYLKQLLPRRADLKLIITSATIHPEAFSKHFNNAPIIEVSGRTYPVETRYRPLQSDDPDVEDQTQIEGILAAVDELWSEGNGDILVFLAGEREIRETAEALSGHKHSGTEILPLYARLSAEEQMRVFHPHGNRRIVLSTNVAETSLTVPGIKYVIDPGMARISRYASRSSVQRLLIEKISQASADQRRGRAGRTSPGICIRLYSQEDYESRARFTDPEILRTHLASVILQMKSLGLGSVTDFPFLQPPDYRQVRDGYQMLHELGAIDEDERLTHIGRSLARMPIDPRLGRMLLAAMDENVVEEVLIIVSALSVPDPRQRPMDQQQAADERHAAYRHEHSDFLAFANLWRTYQERKHQLSNSRLRKWCKENFLAYMRVREWEEIYRQLEEILGSLRQPHRGAAHRR
jgi:ATP-dependent helicase HrpA